MAILATLFAGLSRFLGRFVNMALGWATILLFGQVPESRRMLLSFITLGSLAWIGTVLGVLLPDVGAFLVAAIPAPEGAEDWIRLAMLVAALLLPLLIGIGGLLILDPADRPKGGAMIVQVLRGYLYAPVLAAVLAFLFVEAPVRKARTMVKRWQVAHVPMIVKPGGYDAVRADLTQALESAGLGLEQRTPSRGLVVPARLLAAAGGSGVAGLVPDELVMLASRELEVLIYPSDVSVSGEKQALARARVAIASRLPFTEAYLTASREAQRIEDRLAAIAKRIAPVRHVSRALATATADAAPDADGVDRTVARRAIEQDVAAADRSAPRDGDPGAIDRALEEVTSLDGELAALAIPWDEWEVLYRLRLQVDRDLRAARGLVTAPPGREGSVVAGATEDTPVEAATGPLTRFLDRVRYRLAGR